MQAQQLTKSRGITQLASDNQRLFVKVLSGDGHRSSAVYAAKSGDLVQIRLRKFDFHGLTGKDAPIVGGYPTILFLLAVSPRS